MKILVTGASGFIGKYVIEELLNKNIEVIATSTNLEKANGFEWFNKVTYIRFNLKDFNPLVNYFNYFESPDAIIHLAWEGLPNYKCDFHITENLPRHLAFLSNLIENGLKDVTVTGTCFEYGMQEGCLDEEMECKPNNAYAIAKNELRIKLENLKKVCNFDLKWIRLFYMYGKGQNKNSLIAQLETALSNYEDVFNMSGGEQIRDFLPVENVATYIAKIAVQNKIKGIINVCSNYPIKIRDFVINYIKQKNISLKLNLGYYPYSDIEPMRFWGDYSKLKKIV